MTQGGHIDIGHKNKKGHTDHSNDLIRFRRIRGQIEGIEKMIGDGRYCIDIVNQIRSVTAAIKSAESVIVEKHIRHCVKDAIEAKDSRGTEEKINELMNLFQKR